MALVRFYPTRLNEISEELDRAFNRVFADLNVKNGNHAEVSWNPRVDIQETNDEFVLTLEVPGVGKDDITISYENDLLKISGERKREKSAENSQYLREERFYGKFSRVFNVNKKIDSEKIEAAYKDGLLTIRLPKAEEARLKEIKIKAS
jgi:HSP20 family protein